MSEVLRGKIRELLFHVSNGSAKPAALVPTVGGIGGGLVTHPVVQWRCPRGKVDI